MLKRWWFCHLTVVEMIVASFYLFVYSRRSSISFFNKERAVFKILKASWVKKEFCNIFQIIINVIFHNTKYIFNFFF